MLRVVLNGQPVELPEAPSLADALATAGVHLPALCHDERVAPSGNCRLCLVRIKGFGRPVPACITRASEGMEIETSSPDLEADRRGLLGLLAARYPADAVAAAPDKPLHHELLTRGVGRDRLLSDSIDPALVDRSHPYITVDMNRCIDCARCVRICAEVEGQFVWHVRPDEKHPGTPILHVENWSAGSRAPLLCVDYVPTPERTTPKYPFVLNTGRTLYAFNAATMTGRCRTRELRPSDLLEMSPMQMQPIFATAIVSGSSAATAPPNCQSTST